MRYPHSARRCAVLSGLFSVLFTNWASASDFVPAGVKGNPGWQYAMEQGDGVRSMCQATLIQAARGVCLAATASHCIEANYNRDAREGKAHYSKRLNAYTGTAVMDTADLGKVQVRYYFNPNYLPAKRTQDSAVLSWSCKEESVKLPIVPLAAVAPLQDRENVEYGKVMADKAGLYRGYVYREPNVTAIQGAPIGENQESIVQNQAVMIQQGDSGGGLFRRDPQGNLSLIGVLSTSDDITRRWPIGNYATNRSMELVHRVAIEWRAKPVSVATR